VVRVVAVVAGGDAPDYCGDGAEGENTTGEEVTIGKRDARERSFAGGKGEQPDVAQSGDKKDQDDPEAGRGGARRTGAALGTRRQRLRSRRGIRNGWRRLIRHGRFDARRRKK
jgi:hypothetical protein